jgi:hypothetical protein
MTNVLDTASRHLGGGADDASRGYDAVRHADEAAREAAFERIDSLIRKRLQVRAAREAAHSVVTVADAHDRVVRTRQLMNDRSGLTGYLHDQLLQDRLRTMLGAAGDVPAE